jgi:HEPN domain-containing protein
LKSRNRNDFADWFEIAGEDLASAELLYRYHKFPQALFFLQQGGEKLAKGYMLKAKMIPASKDDELAKHNQRLIGKVPLSPGEYGHNWRRKQDNVARRLMGLAVEANPNPEVRSVLKEALAKPVEVDNPFPSLKEIDSAIRRARTFLRLGKLYETIPRADLQKGFETEGLVLNPTEAERERNMMINALILNVVFVLDVYLFPHEQLSRYPDSETHSKLNYHQGLAIVKRFPEMLELLRTCLVHFESDGGKIQTA